MALEAHCQLYFQALDSPRATTKRDTHSWTVRLRAYLIKIHSRIVINMAEPSPNPALQDIDIDPALMNGLAQQPSIEQPSTDVEMADSNAPQVGKQVADKHLSLKADHPPAHNRFRPALPPTYCTNTTPDTFASPSSSCPICTHTSYCADTHAGIIAKLTTSTCSSAHATDPARQPDESISEPARDATFT